MGDLFNSKNTIFDRQEECHPGYPKISRKKYPTVRVKRIHDHLQQRQNQIHYFPQIRLKLKFCDLFEVLRNESDYLKECELNFQFHSPILMLVCHSI